MERFITLACAAAPGDQEIDGSALAEARGMLALLDGDTADAMKAFGRGIAVLDTAPQRGPAPYRGRRPVLLAEHGDPRAAAAIGHARSIGLTVNRANRGLLGYAEAILAGRASDGFRATELAAAADTVLKHYAIRADLARLHAAGPARADGWAGRAVSKGRSAQYAAGSLTRLFPPDQLQHVLDQVSADITSRQNLNQRRERTYPRVVKRPRHNSYRVKGPGDRGQRHSAPPTIMLVNLPEPQVTA